MKILHTADWHLGQRLKNLLRDEEHQAFFEWLFQTINDEGVELLIVAGDIFDTMNPPNSSRSLYYQFLARLNASSCRHVVIIGGNHDSPNMLDAPKELLASLNIHVIGSAKEQLEDEVIVLKKEDKIEAIIAAVPFLRDQDLRRSTIGEGEMERYEKVQKGLINHYNQVGELVKPYEKYNVPIIATGHLYATNAVTHGENQDNIYMGSVENIAGHHFPTIFDYIALGHIHTAQSIGDLNHIRYSGSPIALSFKEATEQKSVTLLHFEGRELKTDIRKILIPKYRKLKSIEGTLEEVLEKLNKIEPKETPFKTWLKVEISVQEYKYETQETIQELCQTKNLELLVLKIKAPFANTLEERYYEVDLDDLQPKDIFKQKCENMQLSENDTELMLDAFDELLIWDADRGNE
jgi:exonuclease SbcD